MSKVGIATHQQIERHNLFMMSMGGKTRYAIGNRYSDGGAGKRRHRSKGIGGKGK